MKGLIASVVAVTTAGALAGCAQTPQADHGMMMGQMQMTMGSASSPEMQKMMATCMENMQAMSGHQDGTSPAQPPVH